MSSKIFIFAALAVALAVAGLIVIDSNGSDAAGSQTLTYDVGDTMTNQSMGPGEDYLGTVPGITFSGIEYAGTAFIIGNGTLTTAGTYTIETYTGSSSVIDYTTTIIVNSVTPPTPTTYTVTVVAGSGGTVSTGSVTNVASGSTISSSGSSLKINGSTVATASASSGYHFSSWSNASGTVTDDRTVTANFAADTPPTPSAVTLTLQGTVGGSAYIQDLTTGTQSSTVTGATSTTFSVYPGDSIKLTATASSGYVFNGWVNLQTEQIISSDNPWTTTAPNSAYTFVADFDAIQTVTLTLYATAGGSAYIEDTTLGTQSSTVTGPDSTTFSVQSGDTIVLHATASSGYVFNGWANIQTEQIITTDNPWTTTAPNSAYTYAADFEQGNVTLTLYATAGGSAYIQDTTAGTTSTTVTGPDNIDFNVNAGDVIVFTATPSSGYTFGGWVSLATQQVISTDNPWPTTAPNAAYSFVADFGQDCIVTVVAGTGGSVSTDSPLTVPYGATVATDGNVLTIGTYTVTASASTGYRFDSWTNATSPIISNRTITANFEQMVDGVFWSNGTEQNPTYNGRIDILFDMPANSASHSMEMAIYSMTANPDMTVNWTDSGYSLTVTVNYNGAAHISASLAGSSTPVTGSVNPGAWQRILISIDTEHGVVTMTPVRTFTSFTQYTLYDEQKRTVLDFSEKIRDAGVSDIIHSETGVGDSPKFSVVSTRVFLDTYGVVMFGPEINVADYFPQYDALRLNIYSFALYGDSIRLNGQEWAVQDGKITVRYVRDQDGNHVPTYDPDLPVQTRTFALNNIYVTWDGSRCSLTFVDDRFTLDLGTYQPGNLTVSFTGMWYFTTMLWDSSIGTEKAVTGWKALPETTSQQMILIFMGILLLAGVAAMIHVRRSGRGTVDLIVIGAAMVVAFIMLGMWYRWLVSQTSRT